jgi:hypothetical protein
MKQGKGIGTAYVRRVKGSSATALAAPGVAILSLPSWAHSGAPVADRHNQPHTRPRTDSRVGIRHVRWSIASIRTVENGARQRWVNPQNHSLCHSNVSPMHRTVSTTLVAGTPAMAPAAC